MTGDFVFHHLGVACTDIEAEALAWQAFGYSPESAVFVDETQGIRGRFYSGGGPRLELLEAHGGSQTLAPWLKRKAKIYHTGYLVPDLGQAISTLEAQGAAVARAPALSSYFSAPIAFMILSSLALVELIEASVPASASPRNVF